MWGKSRIPVLRYFFFFFFRRQTFRCIFGAHSRYLYLNKVPVPESVIFGSESLANDDCRETNQTTCCRPEIGVDDFFFPRTLDRNNIPAWEFRQCPKRHVCWYLTDEYREEYSLIPLLFPFRRSARAF